MDKYKIFIYGELTRNFEIAPVSLELTAKAAELAQSVENGEVTVFVIGKRMNYDDIANKFSQAGADKVIITDDDIFEHYSSAHYTEAACKIIEKETPRILLIGASVRGRDLAPLITTTLGTGLTADCTKLEITDGKLAATRPTFGGNLNATILCKNLPQSATVRPGVFRIPDTPVKKDTLVCYEWIDTCNVPKKTEFLEFIPDILSGECNLNEAKIIVAGGKGMKSKEGFQLLENLAKELNAAVGATRAAVEEGWIDSSAQIGQTGKTVSAKLYIACGISGAAQHLAGINSCDKIIAINKNPKAPIFAAADYGIAGDVFEILPALTEIIQRQRQK